MIGTGTLTLADAGGIDHMGGWGWGMAILGWLFMTALVALVVWVVLSSARQPGPTTPSTSRAQDILDERYARGEIDRDEYLERSADLRA